MTDLKIFSGKANRALSQQICEYLGVPLGDISLGNFPDGETSCKINEDIRGREHVHLPFGEGDIDFAPVLGALEDAGYRGLVNVELSRQSHEAPEAARRAIEFLRKVSPAWRSA